MKLSNYIGIPFISRGRSMSGGDCYNIVYQFYKHEKNITLPLLDSYATTKDADCIQEIVDGEKPRWQKVDSPEQGDVVVINIGGLSVHVGVYLDVYKMLHAFKGRNSCIESLSSPQWSNRIEGIYRYE